MSYRDLLRLPQWQRRRLEMLETSGFACQKCGDAARQLQVHHKQYVSGRKPWEYTDAELIVLCDDCHEAEHNQEACKVDIELEKKIEAVQNVLVTMGDPNEKRIAWAAMRALIQQRSPRHVKQLEYQRGLR